MLELFLIAICALLVGLVEHEMTVRRDRRAAALAIVAERLEGIRDTSARMLDLEDRRRGNA